MHKNTEKASLTSFVLTHTVVKLCPLLHQYILTICILEIKKTEHNVQGNKLFAKTINVQKIDSLRFSRMNGFA